jgi:hypothetical protein
VEEDRKEVGFSSAFNAMDETMTSAEGTVIDAEVEEEEVTDVNTEAADAEKKRKRAASRANTSKKSKGKK